MTDLVELTVAEALDGLAKKEFSAVELTEAHIKEMDRARELNAYVTETPELALERAKASDERRAKGTAGKMDGIPVGMKDLYCTKGVRTTACSHILDNFVPPYESTVSQKLEDAGTVMLGKTNMDEFAMGTANLTSYFGPVRNPYKRKGDDSFLVPGGSSGGSAAAVASGLCMAATGSDTGGSIREPAAFCGVTGLKPTYGRPSRLGMIAFASSFPGSIRAFEITPGQDMVFQKSAFLAGEAGVNLSIFFNKRFGAGLFGGEGFIMQRVSGQGIVFAEFDGHVIEYELQPGQQIIVDTGHLAAMSATCGIDIQSVPGVKNMLFGGEGFFNTVITGPGHVWLQTMPISNVAGILRPYLPSGS